MLVLLNGFLKIIFQIAINEVTRLSSHIRAFCHMTYLFSLVRPCREFARVPTFIDKFNNLLLIKSSRKPDLCI